MKINRPETVTRYQKISELSVGDPVGVKQATYQEGGVLTPATVCYVDDYQVGVAFSNGIKQMFRKDQRPTLLQPVNRYKLAVSAEGPDEH